MEGTAWIKRNGRHDLDNARKRGLLGGERVTNAQWIDVVSLLAHDHLIIDALHFECRCACFARAGAAASIVPVLEAAPAAVARVTARSDHPAVDAFVALTHQVFNRF